jgi:hypothetical protein
MDSKKYLLFFFLLTALSTTVFASGAWERTRKAVSSLFAPKHQPAEQDNVPMLSIGQLTGHENIIRAHGDIKRLNELLKIAGSGEADSSGRCYFAYLADIRPAPFTALQRELDIETACARAARELNQIDRDFMLIGRRLEETVNYAVDRGDGSYGYGAYYIVSAIPVEKTASECGGNEQ